MRPEGLLITRLDNNSLQENQVIQQSHNYQLHMPMTNYVYNHRFFQWYSMCMVNRQGLHHNSWLFSLISLWQVSYSVSCKSLTRINKGCTVDLYRNQHFWLQRTATQQRKQRNRKTKWNCSKQKIKFRRKWKEEYMGKSGSSNSSPPKSPPSLAPWCLTTWSFSFCFFLHFSILSFHATLPYPYSVMSFSGAIGLGWTINTEALNSVLSQLETSTTKVVGKWLTRIRRIRIWHRMNSICMSRGRWNNKSVLIRRNLSILEQVKDTIMMHYLKQT